MTGTAPHITSFGHGPRTALAVHCTLAHSGAWSRVAKQLAARLTITAFDLPGHGRSAPWDPARDLHDQATDMGRALMSQPMDLIGHSFGATVALRLAVENPEMVRSLTLIEPVFFAAARAPHPERLAAYDADLEELDHALAAHDYETAARAFNRTWGDGSKWYDIPQTTRDYMVARMMLVNACAPTIYQDTANLLAPDRIGRIKVPVLLIEGDQSPDIVDAINEALAAKLPNVRRAVIANAGHMAPITHPIKVAQEIERLLDEAKEAIDIVP